jgi:hypothetical protein
VHGVDPDMTREGGSIPITSVLEDSTGMNVLLLPLGACDDMAHRYVNCHCLAVSLVLSSFFVSIC